MGKETRGRGHFGLCMVSSFLNQKASLSFSPLAATLRVFRDAQHQKQYACQYTQTHTLSLSFFLLFDS